MGTSRPLLFSISSYNYLKEKLGELTGYESGRVEVDQFPDGERYQRILSKVRQRDVIVIGGTIDDRSTLELYDLACGLVKNGARSLYMLIPYYGYATMERAIMSGEVVTGKTRARLLSSIPPASYGNKVVMLDLHSEGIPHYFEGGIVPVHLYGKELVLKIVREVVKGPYVMACTDSGRAKWVESLANDLGVEAGFIFKRRVSGVDTSVSAISADVKGKHVVLYDDMIRTGGSLINAAKAYNDAGASGITAIATHGVFPEGAIARIEQSGLFTKIYCSDSHPRSTQTASNMLEVRTIAPIFAAYLENAFQ